MADLGNNDAQGPPTRPSYFIRTFGCQMNVADSLQYARVLENLGCVRAESDESSDILVVNTCSVRAKAEEKAISYLGSVIRERALNRRESRSSARGGIVLVGCMATVRGNEILRRFREVAAMVPARELESFEDRITSLWPELVASAFDDRTSPLPRPEERFERFVPIIRGCINKCTYCIVPYARGDRLESVPPSRIFAEVESLIASGVKSITFLGQNVCAYGSEIESGGYGFAELLGDIRDRFGDADIWLKFLTSHPRDVSDDLIAVIASHPAFSRHFHLPVQAGDDEVLRRMGRGYTSAQYVGLIDRIRATIPDSRITTDIIVGFPGEDQSAFERTLETIERIRFDAAFTFLYSSRSGTPAEKWADPIPVDEKKRRLGRLIELQNRIALEKSRAKAGSETTVLVEGPAMRAASKASGMVAGRTREEEVVLLGGGADDYGRRIRVRFVEANLRSFTAERIDEKSTA